MNVEKPNSKVNTTVFCLYEADDSVPNLHIALDRYVQQVTLLQNTKWNGRQIHVVLCGDFALGSRLLGLQGASATYPCIGCHVTKNDLAKDIQAEERTLESIIQDHHKVQTEGYTKESKRNHHSVSHEPFFDIPIEQICPPVLHINLGLWNKFFDNLVADLQCLGEKIVDRLAEEEQEDEVDPKDHFKFYVHNVNEVKKELSEMSQLAHDLREEATELEYDILTQSLTSIVEPSQNQMKTIQDLHKEARQMEENASKLRSSFKLRENHNPLLTSLEEELQRFKVRRQAYHSRSFVGNHVAKCLKKDNYTALLSSIVTKTKELCPDLEDLAVGVQMKHLVFLEQFSKCYNVYSVCTRLSPQQINQLEKDINLLVEMYKTKFPRKSFTPKFHYLWKHTIPFMHRTGFALGLFSEQGGEQLHAEMNSLGKRFEGCRNIQGMSPALYHLKCVMEEHLVKVHPSMRMTHKEE